MAGLGQRGLRRTASGKKRQAPGRQAAWSARSPDAGLRRRALQCGGTEGGEQARAVARLQAEEGRRRGDAAGPVGARHVVAEAEPGRVRRRKKMSGAAGS